jgi:hypothetical protein
MRLYFLAVIMVQVPCTFSQSSDSQHIRHAQRLRRNDTNISSNAPPGLLTLSWKDKSD